MHSTKSSGALAYIIVSAITFPSDLVPKVLWAKYRVHQQFQVVAGGGVAVEVDAAGVFEDAVEFGHALGLHVPN